MQVSRSLVPMRAAMSRTVPELLAAAALSKENRYVAQALSLCAARCEAQYIDLISPGPPATPSDYLQMNVSYADAPAFVKMGLVSLFAQDVVLVNNSTYLRRNAIWDPDFVRGQILFRDGPSQFDLRHANTLDFLPELDAGLMSINVMLSASRPLNNSVNVRDVTITGPNGYQRSFTTQNIPEPTSALVALCGAALVGRRLNRRRRK